MEISEMVEVLTASEIVLFYSCLRRFFFYDGPTYDLVDEHHKDSRKVYSLLPMHDDLESKVDSGP